MELETFKKIFAENMRKAREQKKLSQKQLSEIIKEKHGMEISSASLSGYEKGKSLPQLNIAAIIAEELGSSLDALCGMSSTSISFKSHAEIFRDFILPLTKIESVHAGLETEQKTSPYDEAVNIAEIYILDDTFVRLFEEWNQIAALHEQGILNDEMYDLVGKTLLEKAEYSWPIVPF